ncbi:MAG: peptidoglycan-binding protein, partial [Lentihominibacter sp.]|nr:peptidoglycan-binding protein [Lentihominibacter sp.]
CGYSVTTGGTYGAKTIKAVKKLQKKLGLKQDGKFGKKTLAKAKQLKK